MTDVVLHHGDCLDVLREMPDSSVDSVVTDPPYGLSNTTSQQVLDCLTHWVTGDREYVPAGLRGFMGASWDGFVPPPAVWDECLRVLKPGGHMLVFAGSRTQDLMGLSIRLAGFEMRDSIAWMYGTGFPKSLDVSKAIDKADGRSGTKTPNSGGYKGGTSFGAGPASWRTEDYVRPRGARTPLTTDAVTWQGWGTALKPAQEPIIVARKPLSGTVASNVLRHGTGALNIDGCRVPGARPDGASVNRSSMSGPLGEQGRIAPAGRWPANVVLSHTEWCVEVGTRQVRTGTAVNRNRTADNDRATYSAYSMGNDKSGEVSYGTDGAETVAAWNCPEGCPVRELDAQSGTLTSGTLQEHHHRGPKQVGILGAYGAQPGARGFGDTGGASRFFPTFRYQAKAPSSERPGYVDDDGVSQAHSTVKPLELMRWMVRLVTPPGGAVLDLFAGSGTTGEACSLDGFKCVLIEREARYLPLIEMRLGTTPAPVPATPIPLAILLQLIR